MAKGTKTKNSEFKEFEFEGDNGNTFTGRIYPKGDKSFYGLSLTVNGLAITGCKLVEGKNGLFISWPQYKTKDGYKNICYLYQKEDLADLQSLVNTLETLINE